MFAIASTDTDWFLKLKQSSPPRVVNFWTPTDWKVKGLQPGARLYFMLKSPIRRIGGYGIFVRYLERTASSSWAAYGLGNGVASRDELVAKVSSFAAKRSIRAFPSEDPIIGCIELRDIVCLDDEEFIDPLEWGHSFPKKVVKLKYFHEEDRLSVALGDNVSRPAFALIEGPAERRNITQKDRKGQPAFRQLVLRNYGYRCCVSGEGIVELLEAAHIQPYVNESSDHPQNSLCLRTDLHRLFDAGLISMSAENTVIVSRLLRGTSYEALEGRKIAVPTDPAAHPSSLALSSHRNSFRF